MCLADVVQGIVVLRFLRLLPQPRQEVNEARVQKRDALEFVLAGDLIYRRSYAPGPSSFLQRARNLGWISASV